jgi:glycerol-3-phosphate dehydrogenase (NAD(P)+)
VTAWGVIGAGAWGTALADLLARRAQAVRLWAYERDVVEDVRDQHQNRRFLPGVMLSPSIEATGSLEHAVRDASIVLFVTPSHVMRTIAAQCAGCVPPAATVAVATKGIERGTLALMTQVVEQAIPGRPVVAVSGPSFAAEVAQGQPTAVVAASHDAAAAARIQRELSTDVFRVYTDDDVIGVELGGALKNVIAVATGIAEGLGLGHNSQAALITRGLAEIRRLGVALGASPHTFAGLAGMGDLVLTCTGALSRNRTVGVEVGRGARLSDVLASRETVAEGVLTTESAHALATREGIDMPIVTTVYRTLFEGQSPSLAIAELMTRELRAERDR